MTSLPARAAGLAAFALLALPAWAEVRLPGILSDHMVLQRAAWVPVWGWAAPNEAVSVRFGNQALSTVADSEGRWRLHLYMEKPFGDKKGQLPTFGSEEALAGAEQPDIRLFKVAKRKAAQPGEDVGGAWVRSTPAALIATQFSAAAYSFGRRLRQELGTPVGLIDATWGGTRIS